METSAFALPKPLPEDPEVVATALETASIFGVQGDAHEAVRWVRRAAEYAGDAGADDRAYALARAAAELVANLPPSQPPPSPSAHPPAAVAAPAPSAPPPAPAQAVVAPALGAGPPPPPPPPPIIPAHGSNRPAASVSVSPMVTLGGGTPNFAGNATLPLHGAPVLTAPVAAAPVYAPVAPAPSYAAVTAAPVAAAPAYAPSAPVAAAPAYAPPAPVAAAPAYAPPAPVVAAPAFIASPPVAAAPVTAATAPIAPAPMVAAFGAPTNGHGNGAALAEAEQKFQGLARAYQDGSAVASPAPAVYEPVPVQPAFSDVSAPPPAPALDLLLRDAARTAARASIEASQEEGVYIVRLLRSEESVTYGAHEALVVLVDPNSDLFDAS